MGILSWILMGLVAGFLASKIVDKRGEGLLLNMVLGSIGAIVGGYLFTLTGHTGGMMVAIVGAVVVLLIFRLATGERSLR